METNKGPVIYTGRNIGTFTAITEPVLVIIQRGVNGGAAFVVTANCIHVHITAKLRDGICPEFFIHNVKSIQLLGISSILYAATNALVLTTKASLMVFACPIACCWPVASLLASIA